LDGQASNENWWQWKGGKESAEDKPNQRKARDRLIEMVADDTPTEERRFGEGDFLRPSFL
jgi:hypothetical protein